MTTKSPGKVREQPRGERDVQTAYQVHTLAQMLYGQLAMSHPWAGASYPSMAEPTWTPPNPTWAAQWPTAWGAGPAPTYGNITPTMGFYGFPY